MVDWATAKEGIVDEVLRTSETYLTGTVTIAASADQRAAVVAGTFATAGAAIVAGVIGFSAAASADNHYGTAVYAGGLLSASMFIIGALFCIRAAMPVGFNLPGTQPSKWEGDINCGHTMQQCQHDLIRNNEISIKENLTIISKNAKRYTIGAYCGIAAPFVGAAAWLIALLIMKT
jgi:hypothetical protein